MSINLGGVDILNNGKADKILRITPARMGMI